MFTSRKRTFEIPLLIIPIQYDGFHVFVEVVVNSQKTYMLLDTGASRTVFDIESLKKIHLGIEMEENEDKATGLGSNSVDNFVAIINKLEIGELIIPNYEVGALDLSHVNISYSKIDLPAIAGVIGSDLLMRHKAVINYKNKTLTLYK